MRPNLTWVAESTIEVNSVEYKIGGRMQEPSSREPEKIMFAGIKVAER